MNTSENCDIRKEELLRILQKRDITTVFQPIVSLRNGTVYGYEALTRGPIDSVLHLPDDMFESAEKYGNSSYYAGVWLLKRFHIWI